MNLCKDCIHIILVDTPWRYADYLLHHKKWEAEEFNEEMKEIEAEVKEANE